MSGGPPGGAAAQVPPARPVAWGFATWAAPFVPALCFVLLVPLAALARAVGAEPPDQPRSSVFAGLAVVWMVVGLLLGRTAGPRRRGLGIGLAWGAATTLAAAVLTGVLGAAS